MGAFRSHIENCRGQVRVLPARLRAAFAAGCAQRQTLVYTAYAERTRRPTPLRLTELMDSLWNALFVDAPSLHELRSLHAKCYRLVPPEEAIDDRYVANAEYAVTTLAYAIRTLLTGETGDAVWAAQGALNSLHDYLMSDVGGRRSGYDIRKREDTDRVQSDPLLQAEYDRQQRDLAELATLARDVEDWTASLRKHKARSEAEAREFLMFVLR